MRPSKDDLERYNRKLAEENQIMRAQLDLVIQFARVELETHQPYFHASDLDLSCADPAEMKKILGEKIAKNAWCGRCRNPFPCRHIERLRIFRDLGRRYSTLDDLKDVAKRLNDLPEIPKTDGQLDIGL